MRPTVLEIDKNKLINNINMIKKYVNNKEIMPIIKASGYGTYINKDLKILNMFNIVGVALSCEAKEIRDIGYKKEIFVLNQPSFDEIDEILENNITIGLSSIEFLKQLDKINKTIKVHLEIETGMNRTGIKLEDLEDFIKQVKNNKKIIVEGVYTHLSSADFDDTYTKEQINKFNKAVEIVKNNFNTIKYIHQNASNGILKYPSDITNLVRAGIILYGYEPYEGAKKLLPVEPIAVLKTKITYIKDIDKGESISYSRKFISDKKMRIATIPIGYADGLNREIINTKEVVINNKKARIIGTICMDSCMVDITDIKDVKVGDLVYIWDNKNITLEDVAEKSNTINYEILSTISNRVPRVEKV